MPLNLRNLITLYHGLLEGFSIWLGRRRTFILGGADQLGLALPFCGGSS